jgi:hypothetical protein
MKTTTLILFLLTLMVSPTIGRRTADGEVPVLTNPPPTVKFCELLKNPRLYEGKLVRTDAAFRRYGEEVVEFFCPDCLKEGRVDFDIDQEAYESCTKPRVREKIQRGPVLSVSMTGKLYVAKAGEGFGHFGQYRYKFLVSCVERADVVFKFESSPDELPKNVLRRIHCK